MRSGIDSRTPVIILQGFETPSIPTGTEQQATYTVSEGRGIVNRIDFVTNNRILVPLFSGYSNGLFSLIVGGQEFVVNESYDEYSIYLNLGYKDERKIRSYINESQTISFKGSNIDIGQPNTGTIPAAFVILSYVNKAHLEFLRNWTWKTTAGLKRQTFALPVPVGSIAGQTIATANNKGEPLNRSNGNIIAFSIIAFQSDFDDTTKINLSINGVNIVENMPAYYFSPEAKRGNFIHKVFIDPGSTYKLSYTVGNVVPTATWIARITFYFDN